MTLRFLSKLLFLVILVFPFLAHSLEITNLKEKNHTLTISLGDLPLNTNPKSLRFKVEGQEIQGAKLSLEPLKVIFAIDQSVACKIVKLQKYLPTHLAKILEIFPASTTASIFVYDRSGLKRLQAPTPIRDTALNKLSCSSKGSLGFGAIVEELYKQNAQGVDVVIAYTSGNLFFSEKSTATLGKLTQETFILPYLAPPQSNASLGKSVHYRPKDRSENFLNWFGEVETYLYKEVPLEGTAVIPLPETMDAGEYRGTIEILEDAKVAKSIPIVFQKFTPGKSMATFRLPYWAKVLIWILSLQVLVLLYVFFRTPRCRKCKRSMVRGSKVCLFCLEEGAVLLTQYEGKHRILAFKDQMGIGNTRQFEIYDDSIPLGEGGFSVRRSNKIYQIAPYHKELLLNHQKIEQARYLRHGDQISIGDWTCQFFAKA